MLVYQRVPPKFMGIHQLNSFWHLPRAVEFSTGLRYPPGGMFLKLMVSGPWPLSGGERAVKFRRWTSWAGEVGFVQTWGIHPHSMAILRRNRVKGYSIKKLPGKRGWYHFHGGFVIPKELSILICISSIHSPHAIVFQDLKSGRVTFVDIKEYVVFLVPVLPEPQTNGGCWRIYEKHQVWWLHRGGPPKSDVHNGKMGNTTVDGRNPALVGRWFISL